MTGRSYPIVTMADIPEIKVVLINNPKVGSYGGGSEAANALAAPAIAGALQDATGKGPSAASDETRLRAGDVEDLSKQRKRAMLLDLKSNPVKTNGRHPSSARPRNGASEPDMQNLARLLSAYAPHDGSFELRIPGVHASRFSRVMTNCVHALRIPSLCIVAQGAKTVLVGQETFEYDASRMIVFSVALPVASQITQASASEPYLALKLDLDPRKVAELVLKVYPQGRASRSGEEAPFTSRRSTRISFTPPRDCWSVSHSPETLN